MLEISHGFGTCSDCLGRQYPGASLQGPPQLQGLPQLQGPGAQLVGAEGTVLGIGIGGLALVALLGAATIGLGVWGIKKIADR